jgi:hypothetical protein
LQGKAAKLEILVKLRMRAVAMQTLLIIVFCVLAPTVLHANALSDTNCPTNTVAFYDSTFSSQSSACANGILNFSFDPVNGFQSFGNGVGILLTADQIDLSPIGSRGQTGATGFNITGLNDTPITAVAGQDATYVLDWLFVIDSGPIAQSASLGMGLAFGDVTVTQYYCLNSLFQNPVYQGVAPACGVSITGTTPQVQTLSVSSNVNPDLDRLTDSIAFNPPAQDLADVMTVIHLTGESSFDSVNGTAQIDSQAVPEPGGLIPLILQFGIGAGIICLRKSNETDSN